MAEQDGIYKCSVCGNVVSVIEAHKGKLVCCGKPMNLMEPKTKREECNEKHVPIIDMIKDAERSRIKVRVGSVPYPMEESHYIEIIQIIREGRVIGEKRLGQEESPEAEFCIENTEGIDARILCNIHRLLVSE